MAETNEMRSLNRIGEPDRIEVAPGLVLETKLRIKTQRRLERKFNMPIGRIFPGKDDATGESWEGVDFNFLDNVIPLITILAQQIDNAITERMVEEIFEATTREDYTLLTENLKTFFEKLASASPKNPTAPDRAL